MDDVALCVEDVDEWQKLGAELGFDENTLDWIRKKNRGRAESCKLDMLYFWLLKTDDVNSKGGVTKVALVEALKRMGKTAIANRITGMSHLV